MRKPKFLVGAMVGVIGALVVSGTAFAGVPTGQTLQATIAPKKQDKKTFGGASLHAIIGTQYSDFLASPSAKEVVFRIDKQIKFTNGNVPACSSSSLNAATTSGAVQAACGASVVRTCGWAAGRSAQGTVAARSGPTWWVAEPVGPWDWSGEPRRPIATAPAATTTTAAAAASVTQPRRPTWDGWSVSRSSGTAGAGGWVSCQRRAARVSRSSIRSVIVVSQQVT